MQTLMFKQDISRLRLQRKDTTIRGSRKVFLEGEILAET